MRKPSPATQLRSALRDLKDAKAALALCKIQRDQHRDRAEALSKELIEWKRRCDKLIERLPKDGGDYL